MRGADVAGSKAASAGLVGSGLTLAGTGGPPGAGIQKSEAQPDLPQLVMTNSARASSNDPGCVLKCVLLP